MHSVFTDTSHHLLDKAKRRVLPRQSWEYVSLRDTAWYNICKETECDLKERQNVVLFCIRDAFPPII